jgi:hypothetical protein
MSLAMTSRSWKLLNKTLNKDMFPQRSKYFCFPIATFIFLRKKLFEPRLDSLLQDRSAKMFGTAYCLLVDINGAAATNLIPTKTRDEAQSGSQNHSCPCGQHVCSHGASSSRATQVRADGSSSQHSNPHNNPPSPPIKFEYGSDRSTSV